MASDLEVTQDDIEIESNSGMYVGDEEEEGETGMHDENNDEGSDEEGAGSDEDDEVQKLGAEGFGVL